MIEHTSNAFQLPLPLDSGVVPHPKPKGWRYLLANTVGFSKEVENGIRIQKPGREKLGIWIKRLIESGKCESVYVENLILNNQETLEVAVMCKQYDVSLVNITVSAEAPNKVVVGPW
ncbi:deoxyguanosinetriphosphate triphosphohydrolase [Salinimonas sediminis]|uniref:Deoxyguanosinetriphosphate triphosphohydrolase n=1 Tax=Salinimonas sediminis TaxID=2303538 RepID=A0A346NLA7_9ALTE|nr:deoxyguanosinetriphosphate triphosphohydrolase [Salinimonas sediminis]AXR06314.1 deoxyguanosinetriphosphate triphosphohydrolase [Salinimonas sediminis]